MTPQIQPTNEIIIIDNSTLSKERIDDIKTYTTTIFQKMLRDFPSQTPDTPIIINTGGNPGQNVVAYASKNTITLKNKYFEDTSKSLDAITHELFHVLQTRTLKKSKIIPSWITEGTADWARDTYGIQDKIKSGGWSLTKKPLLRASYTDGYSTTARFFKYLDTIHPNATKSLIQAVYRTGTYDDTWWKNTFGLSIDELWKKYITSNSIKEL